MTEILQLNNDEDNHKNSITKLCIDATTSQKHIRMCGRLTSYVLSIAREFFPEGECEPNLPCRRTKSAVFHAFDTQMIHVHITFFHN